MEANQVHPLLGTTIPTLSRSSLPSKLQVINFIRFKTGSKRMKRDEKIEKYREVAKDLVSIWREAYIVVSNTSFFRITKLLNELICICLIFYSVEMKNMLNIEFKPKLFH